MSCQASGAAPGHTAGLRTLPGEPRGIARLLCLHKPCYIFFFTDYSQTKTTRKTSCLKASYKFKNA